jgi:sulfur carrier protein ThiS
MRIPFKLFATLSDYLPPQRVGNIVELDVSPSISVIEVVRQFNLPLHLVHLVLVNGKYIKHEDRNTHLLIENDVLTIWPPVAGG